MKRKHNGGYSLIEVLIAMAVLGIITVPTTSALLTAHRMNVKAEQMLEAQLEVSSVVEELMAKGISRGKNANDTFVIDDVTVTIKEKKATYYKVTVEKNNPTGENLDVSIETHIRATAGGVQ